MDIIIYTKDNCPNCLKVKNILKKYNPKILKLEKDISREKFFEKFPNIKTVPQVIINNKHIGGYDETREWLSFQDPDQNF
tara:strand:- start:241 stop:480 length:240 start_codon:yes stop_codon:yes gene_type:complete